MATLLADGQVVQLDSSALPCRVGRLLGEGGQGEVYEARIELPEGLSRPYALKWYFPTTATVEQRRALSGLIEAGSPSDRFLWPIDLADSPRSPTFGYLMPLREMRFRSILELLQGRVPWSARTVATAAFQLTDAFLRLHSKGLCYRDISFGNVFFDAGTGDILVCDNDNVGINGRSEGGVLGTPRFMAPEIVRGEEEPSTQTDLYSLSVLLFYLCMAHHPLEGARELEYEVLDERAMRQLFGHSPLFVFDPDDPSNRPIPGVHDNALIFWAMYPQFVRETFTQAFTQGLRDPLHGRVREGVWRTNMARLRDLIVDCLSCGAENFHEPHGEGAEERRCWSCKAPVRPRFSIQLGREVIALNSSTQLYPHHLQRRAYDYSRPLAAVSQHPRDPSIWGLRNTSEQSWTAFDADGLQHVVGPGRNIRLTDGVSIDFGPVAGSIRS